MPADFLDKAYWNNRYVNEQTTWDIGKVSAPLKKYIDSITDKKTAILIPGCGNAYEAEYLLDLGFTNITLIDLAPALTDAIEQKLGHYSGKELTVICGDFFDLSGSFDLIIEQTFFCALDPVLRQHYAKKMASLLKKGGKLAGVLFDRSFEGGPPFGGSKKEYEELFSQKFIIDIMEPCYNSIAPRNNSELFIRFIKR